MPAPAPRPHPSPPGVPLRRSRRRAMPNRDRAPDGSRVRSTAARGGLPLPPPGRTPRSRRPRLPHLRGRPSVPAPTPRPRPSPPGGPLRPSRRRAMPYRDRAPDGSRVRSTAARGGLPLTPPDRTPHPRRPRLPHLGGRPSVPAPAPRPRPVPPGGPVRRSRRRAMPNRDRGREGSRVRSTAARGGLPLTPPGRGLRHPSATAVPAKRPGGLFAGGSRATCCPDHRP